MASLFCRFTFPLFYRLCLTELNGLAKNIGSGKKSDSSDVSNYNNSRCFDEVLMLVMLCCVKVKMNRLVRWGSCVKIFHALVELIKVLACLFIKFISFYNNSSTHFVAFVLNLDTLILDQSLQLSILPG